MTLTTSAIQVYHLRFQKVLRYIDMNLDEDLNIDTLSNIAAFSRFHFHRQFTALFGVTIFKYIQLLRLKRASYKLAFRDDSIIDIALASGYDGPEAFTRAFKKHIGQPPSAFKKNPIWESLTIFDLLHEVTIMKTDRTPRPPVTFINFPETRIAVLEHQGDPARIGESIRRFIDWRKATGLTPKISATFNILYVDPLTTPPEDYRIDLCATIKTPVAANNVGIIEKVIPGGRCAVLRHTGSDSGLRDSVSYLYADWLPQSGEELRDFPIYCQRVRFFPDVPEHEAITDIFLPLK